MPNLTARKPARKASRKAPRRRASRPLPRPDFPLFHHGTGRWAKKVRGKLLYFGRVEGDENGAAAEAKWNEQKDDLLRGRTPRGKQSSEGLTVRDLCNKFLNRCKRKVECREMTPRVFYDYRQLCDRLVAHFSADPLVAELTPDDFAGLRAAFAKGNSAMSLANLIQRARVVFHYAKVNRLIPGEVFYGDEFKRPKGEVLDRERAAKGPKLLTAAEAKTLIDAAPVQLRAMLYLGVNCAFGNHDCAALPISALDLDGGWINFPRPKTGQVRRCPIWPETAAALREAIAKRPSPADDADAGQVFITKYGKRWNANMLGNPISQQTKKLMKKAGIDRKGISFYTLRHCFGTVAEDAGDYFATRAIMGHKRRDIGGHYSEKVSDARLQAISGAVRKWLLG